MDAPRIRRRVARNARRMLPRPSSVLALVALAVALGGTGYAAIRLPAGSVGTAQLQDGAVVSSKVKDGSLVADDFAPGQLPTGAQGPTGPAGPQGPAGFSSLTYVASDFGPFPAHTQYAGEAVCASNLHVVSGGVRTSGGSGEQAVASSYPTSGNGSGAEGTTGWTVAVNNLSSGTRGFTVYAICAPAASVSGPR